VTPEAQLGWEARVGRLAAAAAIGAAALSIAAGVLEGIIVGRMPDGARGVLLDLDQYRPQYFAAQIVQALALILAAAALLFLLRCALARRPQVPKLVLPLVLLGPALAIAGGLLSLIEVLGVADEFTAGGARSEKRAETLVEDTSQLGRVLGSAGFFAVAVSFVLVSLNAMRAGLLSRFMGILGVVVGALLVLGLGPVHSIVQAFWFGALAALFLNRWPNDRGPAWDVVEPIPWPSAGGLARGEQAGAIPADDPTIEPAPEPDEPVGDASDPRGEPHPASKKRKRKRRR